jgi:hypothetical protein
LGQIYLKQGKESQGRRELEIADRLKEGKGVEARRRDAR